MNFYTGWTAGGCRQMKIAAFVRPFFETRPREIAARRARSVLYLPIPSSLSRADRVHDGRLPKESAKSSSSVRGAGEYADLAVLSFGDAVELLSAVLRFLPAAIQAFKSGHNNAATLCAAEGGRADFLENGACNIHLLGPVFQETNINFV